MPKVKRPYSRVYWEVLDDPKFEGVWDDDRALATWLRLLIAADMAWPASASLYHGVHRPSLDRLVKARLVDMQGTSRYRIHGLDKERQQRSDEARAAVSSRYDRSTPVERSYTDDDGMRTTERLPSQDEPSKDEQRRAKPSRAAQNARDDSTWRVVQVIEEMTGPFGYTAGSAVFEKLRADVAAHGPDRVIAEYRSLRSEMDGPASPEQLVYGGHKRLFPIPDGPRPKKPEVIGKGGVSAEEAERAFGIVR